MFTRSPKRDPFVVQRKTEKHRRTTEKRPPEDGTEPEDSAGDRANVAVVRVGKSADIGQIAGRIASAAAPDVILHAPWGHNGLAQSINLHRLVHQAGASGKRLAVATASMHLASTAREAGLPVALRPGHIRWGSGRYLLGMGKHVLPVPTAWGTAAAGLVVLALLLLAGYAVLAIGPRTRVVATVPVEELAQPVTLQASTEFHAVDAKTGQVPAMLVSRSELLTLASPVQGMVPIGKTPASLIVSIRNGSGTEILIEEGTAFVGPSGGEYRLDQDTLVPARSSVTQQVTALFPGAKGTLAGGAVLRPLAATLYALTGTVASTSAPGTDELVPGVADEDVGRIRRLAQSMETSRTLADRLLADVPGLVFPETAQVLVRPIGGTEQIGTPGDAVVVQAEVLVTALAVEDWALEELARQILVGDRRGEVVTGSVDADALGVAVRSGNGVQAQVRLSLLFAANVDTDEMRSLLEGKRASEVQPILADEYEVVDAAVERSPSFWPWLPRVGSRIEVVLNTRAAGEGDQQVTARDVR